MNINEIINKVSNEITDEMFGIISIFGLDKQFIQSLYDIAVERFKRFLNNCPDEPLRLAMMECGLGINTTLNNIDMDEELKDKLISQIVCDVVLGVLPDGLDE